MVLSFLFVFHPNGFNRFINSYDIILLRLQVWPIWPDWYIRFKICKALTIPEIILQDKIMYSMRYITPCRMFKLNDTLEIKEGRLLTISFSIA